MRQIQARGRFACFVRDGGGATAIEVALLLPVLVVFLLGVMEFGRLFFTQASLQYAVSQAARCRAINVAACATDPLTASYAASKAIGITVSPSVFTVTVSPACGILVSAGVPFAAVRPIPLNLTLAVRACHPA